jgi:hypothetical protein
MPQIALAVPLLVSPGVVLRTLDNRLSLDPGFDAANVLTAPLSLQDARYVAPDVVLRLFETHPFPKSPVPRAFRLQELV